MNKKTTNCGKKLEIKKWLCYTYFVKKRFLERERIQMKKEQEKRKEQKGITLVALVITNTLLKVA